MEALELFKQGMYLVVILTAPPLGWPCWSGC